MGKPKKGSKKGSKDLTVKNGNAVKGGIIAVLKTGQKV